jgi:hypothetical protein
MEDQKASQTIPASALHGRATEGGVKLEGSEIFRRFIAPHDSSERDQLHYRVWAQTPWVANFWTGRGDERRREEIWQWCEERFGLPAQPFGSTPRPGRWREGNATVMGWSWWGFDTEAAMNDALAAWPHRGDHEGPHAGNSGTNKETDQ